MTTKECVFITSDFSSDNFSNLNLNQNIQKPKIKLASFESYKPCNKMSAAASVMKSKNMGTSNTFTEDATNNFTRNSKEQAKEKRFLSTEKTTTNKYSKSSISLHIAVHENSEEHGNFGAGESVKNIIRAKNYFADVGFFGVFQNAFEFSRQQENNDPNIPEVVQFRVSQRLLNPNSNLNAIESTASVIQSHNIPEIVQELNGINHPPPVQNGNELQINQLHAFEGEISYSQKLRPNLLFFRRDAETYFCFCIPAKARSAVLVKCRNCKDSKLWEVLDGRFFVTDPREGHNCTGIRAFDKFFEVRNNEFCYHLHQGMIQAESPEHLYRLYELHMGVYLPRKSDTQKRDLKRALSKKHRGEFVLLAVHEPAETVQEREHVPEAVQELVHAIEQPTAAVEQPPETQEEPAFPEQRKRRPSQTNDGAASPKRPNIDNEKDVNQEDENWMEGGEDDFDDLPSASPQHPSTEATTSHTPSANEQVCDASTVLQPSPCSKLSCASSPSDAISSIFDFSSSSSSPTQVAPIISSPTSPLDYGFDPTVSSSHPNSLQGYEEESSTSPPEQQMKRTRQQSEETDDISQLLMNINLYKEPSENNISQNYKDTNEIIRKLFLSATPTTLSGEIYAKCLEAVTHSSICPTLFFPFHYFSLRAKAKQETMESPGRLYYGSHVLLFKFHRFYSQGIKNNCQLNTIAFAEKMIEREIILPIFERGCLTCADGKIQKEEYLLPKNLFEVIADGLIRGYEVYMKLPNISEKEVPGFWVPEAQHVMNSALDCSKRIYLTKGKTKEIGIKLYVLMHALIETKELEDIAQRYYAIVIDRAAFLIVFNKSTGSLGCFDGHSHHNNKTGALIALTTKENLINFVNIILDEFVPFASSMSVERENVYITCIYHKDPGHISYGKDAKPDEKISRLNNHLKPERILNGESYKEYLKKLNITCSENGTNVRHVESAG